MKLARSPLAPDRLPELPSVAGVRGVAQAAGLRYRGRDDLLLLHFPQGASVAGVLTRSKTPGAPVEWCKAHLPAGRATALLVNAGNANAFTGRRGRVSVERAAEAVAQALNCPPGEVFLASTGVIGEPMQDDRLVAAIGTAAADLGKLDWARAAGAITTTDTFPKAATRRCEIDGHPIALVGIAKGSGMIAPDMATMLSFVATDAGLRPDVLQSLLVRATDRSFNCVTVDGDTSTSDTVLLFATGAAGACDATDADDPRLAGFAVALEALMTELAQLVARDGEGAQKFITISLQGATDDAAARRIGLAVANSPLVKTAIAGEDANWGRIVMALGKSGEAVDRDRLAISIGGITIAREGERVPDYDEAPVADHMKGREIEIGIEIGLGEGAARVWTCDLTHGYIDINADYRS
ncbi:bifunctional glutamate N-acetyltransferase/amino-acid acetyltransferase ArgJ [Algihabitans albus]|uniref:bifunctional glutamate N-acetyltransferase/amino-acid acetyltransferase ArgJ n=1 Tax=Algihabitans albus TaxID=2164067 RepID=UPI000E5C5C72|nr:bifunctional glutamate N-acetyltransferase/amino-acid acetyltransferase ArgJ [Algihabitans albus]